MTIIRLRGPGKDTRTGDPIAGTPGQIEVPDAFVAPRSSSDINDRGRDGVIVGLSLFAPFGVDVIHGDQIRIIDETPFDGLYDVEGEAGQWKQPWSRWEAGCEIALVRATG